MKTRTAHPRARHRGLLLLEVIVYLAIFALVLGMATEAFYQCWTSSAAFRRDTDELARALTVGERWRADVRAASGVITRSSDNGVATFRIPQTQGEVVYAFAESQIRRSGPHAKDSVMLSHIKSSEMLPESQPFGVVCRWELELASKHPQKSALRPILSFQAVATSGRVP